MYRDQLRQVDHKARILDFVRKLTQYKAHNNTNALDEYSIFNCSLLP